jgi:hypothetical protein
MPKPGLNVVPIRRDALAPDTEIKVADLAYDPWLANGFRGGSPVEALFAGVRQLRRRTTAGLFLVPKHKFNRSPGRL